MNEDKKQKILSTLVCLCLHFSHTTTMCVISCPSVFESFTSTCTQTHTWVLGYRISHHTHHHAGSASTPSLTFRDAVIHCSSPDPWLVEFFPPSPPITSQLGPPLPAIHNKPTDHLLIGSGLLICRQFCWTLGGCKGFRAVLYLTCSPHPDPLPHTDSSKKINTSLVFWGKQGQHLYS